MPDLGKVIDSPSILASTLPGHMGYWEPTARSTLKRYWPEQGSQECKRSGSRVGPQQKYPEDLRIDPIDNPIY